MKLKLADEEMQAVGAIARTCDQTVESLIKRLEMKNRSFRDERVYVWRLKFLAYRDSGYFQ